MSETDSEESESFTPRPSGPRARPPLSRMNRSRRRSPRKHSQSRSKVHCKETYRDKKVDKNRSDDNKTDDSESNSLNNKSQDSNNSEFKSSSPEIPKNRTTEQEAKQRKNVRSNKSPLLHRALWEKDINHIVAERKAMLIIGGGILFCVLGYCYMCGLNNSISKNIIQFEEDIEDIKKKFPMQKPDIWDDFSAGVKTVIEESSKQPAIFVLVANNSNTIDCLSVSLGNLISRSLGGKACLILDPKNFITNSGELLEWLTPKIEQKKAVVVNDILKVNSEAIGVFHWLCDDTNPSVSRAVYLITMTINRLHMERQNLTKLVEEQIYNTFSNAIDFDTLHALVSRITSGLILPIQSEPNVIEGAECP